MQAHTSFFQNEIEIDQTVKKLGAFIDDTDTLKKRLKIKKRQRLGNSL